ncbi:hypothetical protein AMTR_s00020p00224020 [Amborella trichopoda]|uniref:Uncharacterized protein n=1 Tax=Amborella trichopoda TaxID=13333 RepID=W1PPF4_AMBTC|nr:hypothetical protein AMTR_s00020p00224020 [Amborella trichopoda]
MRHPSLAELSSQPPHCCPLSHSAALSLLSPPSSSPSTAICTQSPLSFSASFTPPPCSSLLHFHPPTTKSRTSPSPTSAAIPAQPQLSPATKPSPLSLSEATIFFFTACSHLLFPPHYFLSLTLSRLSVPLHDHLQPLAPSRSSATLPSPCCTFSLQNTQTNKPSSL